MNVVGGGGRSLPLGRVTRPTKHLTDAHGEPRPTNETSRVEVLGSFLAEFHEFSLLHTAVVNLVQRGKFSSNTELEAMTVLALDGAQRAGELAAKIGLTAGGTTNLLDRLEAAGLIRRSRPTEGDRRSVVIELTPDGSDLVDRTAETYLLTFSLASRLVDHWRDTFARLGFDVGASFIQDASPHQMLQQVRKMARVGVEMHALQANEGVFGSEDPSPSATFSVLWMAQKDGAIRPRDIARAEHLSPAGTTELLDRLEAARLIERSRSTGADGRGVDITVTEHGRQRLEKAIVVVEPAIQRFTQLLFPT